MKLEESSGVYAKVQAWKTARRPSQPRFLFTTPFPFSVGSQPANQATHLTPFTAQIREEEEDRVGIERDTVERGAEVGSIPVSCWFLASSAMSMGIFLLFVSLLVIDFLVPVVPLCLYVLFLSFLFVDWASYCLLSFLFHFLNGVRALLCS